MYFSGIRPTFVHPVVKGPAANTPKFWEKGTEDFFVPLKPDPTFGFIVLEPMKKK